jgi:hypothetical protein
MAMPANCSKTQEDVSFEFLTAGSKKRTILWVVDQLSLPPAFVGFLLGFDLEVGGDVFLKNVGLSSNYTELQPTRPHFSNHRLLWNFRIFLLCSVPGQYVVKEYDCSLGNPSRLKASDSDLKPGHSDALTYFLVQARAFYGINSRTLTFFQEAALTCNRGM